MYEWYAHKALLFETFHFFAYNFMIKHLPQWRATAAFYYPTHRIKKYVSDIVFGYKCPSAI